MRLNTRHHIKIAAISVLGGLFAAGAAQAANDPTGVWLDDTGRGAIEIKDCSGKLCGNVVWTRDTTDNTKGCGKQIIGDVADVGDGVWDNGWIYSPEKERRYDLELTPLDDGTLQVKGYAGTKFFSKTMIWTRADKGLERCDAEQSAATEEKADDKPEAKVEKKAAAVEPDTADEPVAAEEPAAKKSTKSARVDDEDEPAPKPKKKQKSTEAEDAPKADGIDIDELQFGEYGVKRQGKNDCLVNLPYGVKITVPCDKLEKLGKKD